MATSNNATANVAANNTTEAGGGGSILQELCSRPKNYANPLGSKDNENSSTTEMASDSSLKMKIKRSNSTNSSNGKQDLHESDNKKTCMTKKRKEPNHSSSSTSSSRSSSPRSSASPISQLPPFLLSAITAGKDNAAASNAGGPRLDALLRQVANGPPNKKAKLNGDCSNGSLESEESSPSSVASPLQGNTSGGSEAATMTEPESLGPCEPGTAVKIQGIVWQETEKGLLMLNVTWKGKTYMGTLLDCHIPLEDHKWGPPGEILADKARGKRGRCTRSRTPPVRIPIRKNQKAVNNKNNARAKQLFSLPVSPLAKENGKKNTHKSFDDDNDESDITKDDDSDENNIAEPDAMSPTSRLIECPKPACAKKFRDLDALKYHLSYAHDDLKKAAAFAAERRQKLLEKAMKEKAAAAAAASNVTNGKKSGSKKAEKQENGAALKSEAAAGVTAATKPPKMEAASSTNTAASVKKTDDAQAPPSAPLDLQKRPVSPAYSDISDEEPPSVAAAASNNAVTSASVKIPSMSVQPLAANLPSLNNLVQRPQLHPHVPGASKHALQPPQPPPAHSNSLKKQHLSLEESLKRPPQFMPPGFMLPGGLLGAAGTGLPAHLAAAVASGRYPPGFMPVGFSPVSRSPYLPPPPTSSSTSSAASAAAAAAQLSSASAKLQELQDRVMASTRPTPSASSLHFSSSPTVAAAAASLMSSASTNPSTMTSFSSLARDLLQQPPPSAHYSSLSRMAAAAGSLSAAGLLSGAKHLPNFPPK